MEDEQPADDLAARRRSLLEVLDSPAPADEAVETAYASEASPPAEDVAAQKRRTEVARAKALRRQDDAPYR